MKNLIIRVVLSSLDSIDYLSMTDTSRRLNSEERRFLLSKKICLYCCAAQLSEDHLKVCHVKNNKKATFQNKDVEILSSQVIPLHSDDTN
jgi:hypothetical protein